MKSKEYTPTREVANYILALNNLDDGDTTSNLKLQKLLYYTQGFHLAMYGKPLFNDRVEKWALGPVVPPIYQQFKRYNAKAIPIPTDCDFSKLSRKQKDLIGQVFNTYGRFAAWKLSQMTHEESPWVETKNNEEITHERMKKYFLTQIA